MILLASGVVTAVVETVRLGKRGKLPGDGVGRAEKLVLESGSVGVDWFAQIFRQLAKASSSEPSPISTALEIVRLR